jgi:beta-lactamase regulating signal transducer with metallopeptidase domain
MIKVSCIILVGLIAAALLRRRSAAARHWVLAIAILCAAATPALEFVVPSWHLPGRVLQFAQQPRTLQLYTWISARETTDAAAALSGRTPSAPLTGRALTVIWLAGVIVGLAVLFAGCVRLVLVTSRARPIRDRMWVELTRTLARDLEIGRPIALLQSDHPTLCFTWGVRRPAVILPDGADAWSVDRKRIVLGHELAHIARNDWAVQIAAELLRAAYWFNPLVWIARAQLRRESEHACDDAVLGLGVHGSEYATHLLDLARAFNARPHPGIPAPAMARPSSLERRVRAMLNVQVNRTPLTRSACAFVVAALLLITLPVASAQGGPATFSGSLVDAVGRVMPDVTLKMVSGAMNPKTDASGPSAYQAVSDANGNFSFSGLPAGDYTIQVSKPGFAPTQGRVTLGGGQHLEQIVALQIGALMETITIREPEPGAPVATPGHRAPAPAKSGTDDACSQTVVGGCITQPMKTVDVKPIYPAAFVGTGTSATLKFEARVGTDGLVNEVHPLSEGQPEFITAAMDGIRQWQFTQTRLDGVPVEVRIIVMVTFQPR